MRLEVLNSEFDKPLQIIPIDSKMFSKNRNVIISNDILQ